MNLVEIKLDKKTDDKLNDISKELEIDKNCLINRIISEYLEDVVSSYSKHDI